MLTWFKKTAEFAFFQRDWSMLLVKIVRFCELFVLCRIHGEKVFGDVLVKTSLSRQWKREFKQTAKLAFLQTLSVW